MSKKKSASTKDWSIPVDVSDVDVAFPASVIGRLLPTMAEIPSQFNNYNNEWTGKAGKLMFTGGTVDLKEGIDRAKAFRQLKACLGSFEPKHEHKEAGVGYLLSLWCNSSK